MEIGWDRWAEVSVDVDHDVKDVLRRRLDKESEPFKVAVISSLIETLAEELRSYIELPKTRSDGEKVESPQ